MTTIAPGEAASGAGQDARDRRILLRWTAGLAALMGVSLIVAALLAARPAPSVRYISPPLPDGTRYTFLYPAALGQARTFSRPLHGPGGMGSTSPSMVFLSTPLSPFERLLAWSPFLWRAFHVHSAQRQYIILYYSRAPALGSPLRAMGQDIRSESVTSGRNMVTHRVTLMDTASGVRASFELMDFGPGVALRAGSDARIADSFRAIPPGVAPDATESLDSTLKAREVHRP